MKVFKLFTLLSILLGACVYDPPNPGPSFIYNCSDEAIYVYHSLNGELDMNSPMMLFEEKKEEFMFKNIGCERLLKSPDYRINAYEEKEFPLKDNFLSMDSIVFYFFTERTMKELTWEEIVEKQRYSKRISLSREEYLNLHRVVTYVP